MKTEVKVIADSISPNFERLTSLQVCCPRFILAELNTHRVLSRNYRSSRAVPVAKLIEEVRTSPFIPSQFTQNKPGMQGGEALSGARLKLAEQYWRDAANIAANTAEELAKVGVHKQYANRGLEPYLYVHGIITATEWENFFALRCHPDSQPEFQELATMMRDAMSSSTPVARNFGSPERCWDDEPWHLPYVSDAERRSVDLNTLMRRSAARCAWVSYKPFGDGDLTDDDTKVNRTLAKLLGTPMHASPFEHVACPGNSHLSNFVGWVQWRHILEEERHG